MLSTAVLERYIWWVSIVACVALFARLRVTGLNRTYRFFSYYLLVRIRFHR